MAGALPGTWTWVVGRSIVLDGDHKALVDAALPVCVRYGLAVAGGYAVKAHGLVERPSETLMGGRGTCLSPFPSAGLIALTC